MKLLSLILSAVTAACLLVISLVSFHSVSEIHYLKTFYPDHFSVSEAVDAATVEMIKVLLVALPLVLTICVCLFLMRRKS